MDTHRTLREGRSRQTKLSRAQVSLLPHAQLPHNPPGIKHSASPLLKMSFETTCTFLVDATAAADSDKLESPSSRLILGRPVWAHRLIQTVPFSSHAQCRACLWIVFHARLCAESRSRQGRGSSTCVFNSPQREAVEKQV